MEEIGTPGSEVTADSLMGSKLSHSERSPTDGPRRCLRPRPQPTTAQEDGLRHPVVTDPCTGGDNLFCDSTEVRVKMMIWTMSIQ